MNKLVLVLNSGSSSIKFAIFIENSDPPQLVLRGAIEGLQSSPQFTVTDSVGTLKKTHSWVAGRRLTHDTALAYLGEFLTSEFRDDNLGAVGHRVVHGGCDFSKPAVITPEVIVRLERLIPLAPLHQPHNLAAIRAISEAQPQLPQVACFDTAFHSGQSEMAQAFALPRSIVKRGVRRYGFHGLSYEYIAGVLPEYDSKAASGRVIVAHLGSGASMCALRAGKSIATTMGFTPADGLPMGTRCGSLDPGVIIYLMDEFEMDVRQIERLIYQQSGLLGLSEISSDMRVLLESSDPRAKFAIDLFIYRISRELGSMAAALGGLDALVLTGGIGEHSARIRERVCNSAEWLGVKLDSTANERGGPRISSDSSTVSVWTIPTNEELLIARHTCRLVGTAAAAA